MEYKKLFKVELTEMNTSYHNQQELFSQIAGKLVALGFVKKTFRQAITAREERYPTGLEMDEIAVAIPHTDIEHVIEPFVYVIKLAKPMIFIKMGTTSETLLVSSVFVLGIKHPQEQVGLLSGFIDLLQNRDFIQQYSKLETVEALTTLIKLNFRSEEK